MSDRREIILKHMRYKQRQNAPSVDVIYTTKSETQCLNMNQNPIICWESLSPWHIIRV